VEKKGERKVIEREIGERMKKGEISSGMQLVIAVLVVVVLILVLLHIFLPRFSIFNLLVNATFGGLGKGLSGI